MRTSVVRAGTAAIVAACILCFALQEMALNRRTSMTWDEGHHLFDGYTVLTQQDYGLNPEVPPLAKVLAAAPLLRMHLHVPVQQGRPSQMEAFLDGKDFLFRNDADRLLTRGRAVISLISILLLLLVFAAGRLLFGRTAALLAIAFLSFDPTLLAHGALVTTDAAISCCIFAAVLAWQWHLREPGPRSLLVTALVTGAALACKFTGIFLFPIFALLLLLQLRDSGTSRLLRKALDLFAVAALALLFLWACYGFRYSMRPSGKLMNPPLDAYLQDYARLANPAPLALLARWHVLPEAFLWGLVNTKLTEARNVSYLFGHIYQHGRWFYFPAAIAIKSTCPFLILLAIAAVVALRNHKVRMQYLALLVPVIVFLVVAMHSAMNIGIRHLLPIYPFLYLVGAGALAQVLRRGPRWYALVATLLCWQVFTVLRAFPADIAYANEFWGGPAAVHRYLSDSNSDWGQQLKTSAAYLQARGVHNCWIAYTASGVVDERYYGLPCKRLPTMVTLYWLHVPMNVPSSIDGPVLISDDILEGLDVPAGAANPYQLFRDTTPTAVLDGGMFVFDGHFNVTELASMVDQVNRAAASEP